MEGNSLPEMIHDILNQIYKAKMKHSLKVFVSLY